MIQRTADYWIFDARRFGAKVIVAYGRQGSDGEARRSQEWLDGTVGVYVRRFPTIDQASEYIETIERISTTWEA